MQNEGHEFKTYKKTLKAKIVEFTAVRVSSMAAGNIGKMLRRMNVNLEAKAARNLSSVLTDERNKMAAKIEQNDQRASYLSEPSNIGQMSINKVVEEKHNIEYENAKLKVEVKELTYKINKLNSFVSAKGLHTTEADNIKSKLNKELLTTVEGMSQKLVADSLAIKTEEVESTKAIVPVEEITKEITVPSESLIKEEKSAVLPNFNHSRQERIKPVEEPVVNALTNEQDGFEGFEFLADITRNIKAQKKANEDLTKDNKELRSELASKTVQLNDTSKANEILSKDVTEKDKVIAKVEEEKRIMQEAMQAAAVKAITERNELLTHNKQAEARVQTTTEENQQLREQLREANETVTLITKDRDKLQKDNADYQRIAVEATSKTQSVTIANEKIVARLEESTGLIDSITKDRDKYLSELNNFKKALKIIQASCSTEPVLVGQQESKQM